MPVVVFGQNSRRETEAFAAEHDLNDAELARNHLASGLIQCGNAHGAGQLTLSDDVVTTAAHVFYDENGLPRARSCTFDITVGGREVHVPIDLASIVAGGDMPKNEFIEIGRHEILRCRLHRLVPDDGNSTGGRGSGEKGSECEEENRTGHDEQTGAG